MTPDNSNKKEKKKIRDIRSLSLISSVKLQPVVTKWPEGKTNL